MKQHPLHLKAVDLSKTFLTTEKELVVTLQEVEKEKVFLLMGYPSMHSYCTLALGLSDSQAYTFVSVSRTCVKAPLLHKAIQTGEVSVSKARRIVSVLSKETESLWVEKASQLTSRELEREVVKVNPRELVKEAIVPIANNLSKMTLSLTHEEEKFVRETLELLSKNAKTPLTLSQSVLKLCQFYRSKKDPIQKAERAMAKPVKLGTCKKIDVIPTHVRHQVNHRDKGLCRLKLPNGKPCLSSRWTDAHHIKLRSQGGTHTLDNLVTLCKAHHRMIHSHHHH